MKPYKIVFFGLGSIGTRHARIISELYPQHSLYAFRSDAHATETVMHIPNIYTWEEFEAIGPDVAFITNPTFLHIDTALACAKRNCHLFIEKPIDVSDSHLNELISVAAARQLTVYVAYVLRFHPVVKFLKSFVKPEEIAHVDAQCRTYYPSWRKGQDHLSSYSAFEAKSGGAILELSHEFDYVTYLCGRLSALCGSLEKKHTVTVDAHDYVDATFCAGAAATGHIVIDMGHQPESRTLTLSLRSGNTIHADFLTGAITVSPEGVDHSQQVIAGQMYTNQISWFFDNMTNPALMNNLADAQDLFSQILTFKESAR